MSQFETSAIRTQADRSQYREHSVPLYLSSSYTFESAEQMRALFADECEGNIYSRYSNPNTTELIEKVCAMEAAEAGWATATGMAAVFTSLAALLSAGDHIVACRSVFGSTHQLFTKILPKWGIRHTYVDIHGDDDAWLAAIRPETKILFAETPSNPGVDIIDLERLGKLAKANDLLLLIDNCFATPYIQKPIRYGADLVIHSATKYMDGQGRVLGGLIVGKKELIAAVEAFARHSGPAMSPFHAWLLSKSLETLAIRMDRHSENAFKLACFLEANEAVEKVRYPFLKSHPQYETAKRQMSMGGGIVSFVIVGGIERGRRFIDALQMASITANLGDTRTIVTHPASTTHARLSAAERLEAGIHDGLIRISAGLEGYQDIENDIKQALIASR